MSSFLEQLENNEATLLMYLAGELPQADQDEVEQMLQRDASMRATLADLASLQNDLGVSMSIERDVVASRREAAVRQVGRAIAANASRPAAAVAGKIESRRRGLSNRLVGLSRRRRCRLGHGVCCSWQAIPAR